MLSAFLLCPSRIPPGSTSQHRLLHQLSNGTWIPFLPRGHTVGTPSSHHPSVRCSVLFHCIAPASGISRTPEYSGCSYRSVRKAQTTQHGTGQTSVLKEKSSNYPAITRKCKLNPNIYITSPSPKERRWSIGKLPPLSRYVITGMSPQTAVTDAQLRALGWQMNLCDSHNKGTSCVSAQGAE